jgi:hypothetical protein
MLLYALAAPTLGAVYEDKKKLLIIESALGDTSGLAWKLATDQEKETLLRNGKFVPQEDVEILRALKAKITEKERSYFWLLLTSQNPYFLLYTAFSILVPLLLLLKNSYEPIIFLPLLSLCFVFDNIMFASPPKSLLPPHIRTEEELTTYLTYKYSKPREEALYYFLLERAKSLDPQDSSPQDLRSKPFLMLFFSWNMLFALVTFKESKKIIYSS